MGKSWPCLRTSLTVTSTGFRWDLFRRLFSSAGRCHTRQAPDELPLGGRDQRKAPKCWTGRTGNYGQRTASLLAAEGPFRFVPHVNDQTYQGCDAVGNRADASARRPSPKWVASTSPTQDQVVWRVHVNTTDDDHRCSDTTPAGLGTSPYGGRRLRAKLPPISHLADVHCDPSRELFGVRTDSSTAHRAAAAPTQHLETDSTRGSYGPPTASASRRTARHCSVMSVFAMVVQMP
jgi:hypothetical protein